MIVRFSHRRASAFSSRERTSPLNTPSDLSVGTIVKMESTTVSRQINILKKKNKENVQPAQVVKSFIKQNASKAAPDPQLHANKKMVSVKSGKVVPAQQSARRQVMDEHSSTKTATLKTSATAKKLIHSQDSKKIEQAAKVTVGEPPKPSALQPPRSAPGMYKGKIIESKIGSIWKSSASAKGDDQKSISATVAYPKSGNLTTSAVGRGSKTVASTSNRSVKPSSSSQPPNTFYSARPPARSVPTTVRPKMATVAQSRRCGTMIVKPKEDPVIVKKASKPPLTSTIRQYKTHGETAEEKKAKLAEWLAAKGKTLKRPAMSAAPPTNSKVSYKSAPPPKSQLSTRSKSAAEVKEASVPPALTADNQETDKRTSLIMNTTLDLLENSVLDQPRDSDSDRVGDIVLNLCDALEALEPPSRSDDQLPQMNECNDEYNECKQEDIKNETADEIVKSESSTSDEQDVIEESEESDDEYVKKNTPPMKEASVVKYSIKTTPFLQSVKKTIEDDVCISTSKKKSNIKDLKFLTPVRRSSRIHRQSSRLPAMLADHDPCVSSLAELVKLDDDANAYIYRKNPALLEDLPDQPRL